MVDSDLFDLDMELDFLDQEANNNQPNEEDDDFGDDDLDLNELVEVAETVEQQHAVGNGNISFVSAEDDPIPPPPLPASTPCFHPIHPQNLRTWIYPTNYPIRGYQLNIVQKAMFNNTLVALPTGLGKTFIAAVVMFNYWRWFPNSKIIFMAPTRPLVEQQIEACFTICGLPQEDTVEITGSTTPAKRKELWKSKRVFFATPQTVQKDIETHGCPSEKIACVVVDEAHKATGNYAYTEVIRKLYKKNKHFRILALTATPGSAMESVQNVVDHLHITNIQIRTEDSMDIREFSHGKNIQHIVVKLGYTEGSTGILPRIIDDYRTKVFQPMLLDLSKKPIDVHPDVDRASPYGLMSTRLRFQAQAKNLDSRLKYSIICQVLVAEAASRAHDLLCQHGMAPFLESIEGTFEEYKKKIENGKKPNKAETFFYNHSILNAMIRNIKQEVLKPDFIGHPKMDKLVGILLSHFSGIPEGEASKVMIFSSFRSSVIDICRVLDRHRPMVRSSFFVGQSTDRHGTKGLKQSEQQEVIQKFKKDEFNVLVSTSIGEEGLDIGEVDLIVCYDSQTSPIRMLQRMGRTGRKRKGKCILLLTEAEEKKFASAKETYARIQGQISRGGLLTYYKPDPVILPPNYKPTICRKMVTVGTYQPKITSARKRKRDIIEDPNYGRDGLLKPEAERNFVRSFCDRDHNFTNMEQVMTRYWPIQKTLLCLNKYVPLQARARSTFRVGHSSRTSQLVNLVQKCEHRILHPEEKIDFQLEPRKKQQTKLNLPQKAAATKKAQERGRRKTSSALDDADFADFIENNDVSRFIDTEEFTTENITDFFLPTKKKPVTGAPQPSVSLSKAPHVKNQEKDQEKDKGKSKIIPSKELHKEEGDTLFDDFGEGFEDEDREPSWEPILPDSFDENIVPLTDTRQQKKAESSTCVSNKQAQSTIYDAFMDINQNTSNLITLPSSITSALQPPASAQQLRVSVQQPHQTASNDMDQDSDEFFDFPMDDSFIAQAEALIVSNKLSCFSDVLEPVFPFERSINAQRTEAIAFVWAHTVPKFSDKAMKLLEKRQMDIKEMTGHFVLMNLFPQFKSSKQKSNAIIELDQKEDDDFSSMDGIIEQAALVEHQVVQHRASPHQEHEVISIDESQPLLDDNDAASATVSAANKGHEEDDDFDFDISEGVWANFIENKCEENDEPQGFPYSMFDPEPSPSKPPQIMSKSFLYADKPSTTANIEEDDDDQSFEYIFSQESSSSQKVIEEQDITEPKQAEQNELEPEQEVKAELDKLESVQEDQENRHAHELVKKEDSSGVNQKENYQSQSSDSDKDTLLLELDVEDFLRNDSGLLDAIKENGVSKAVEEEQEIDSIDKLIVMNDKNELEMDQYATVIKQAQEIQEKHDDAVETETIDQDHHSIISIQSNITDESPVVQFRSIKKTKAIISEDEQEETPETSPNRNLQSPSLLNQLSKGLYTPSPLRIQSSDNDESPIQLFRKRKSIRTIQDDEEDEVVLVYEQRESRKRRLKRKSTTPTLHHNNSTIFEIAEEEEEEELLLAPPSKNNLMNRLKQSSYGVHRQKRTSHRHYSQDTLENPFIDAEAEKSSDEGHTDDDIDEDQGSSCMNSFIDDNSSLGHMESSHVDEDEDDLLQFRKKSINIYAESLYKDDNPRHEKHWLNKFNADKWLDQGNEDEDEIIGDTDEESIQDFSSDLHHLAQNNNNGDILDDDFM